MEEFKFMPKEKFSWVREYEDGSTQLVGEYHPGMTYNCTRFPVHDALREKCKEWLEADQIVIIPLSPGQYFEMTQQTIPAEEAS